MADAPWRVLDLEAYSCLKQAIVRFLIDFEDHNEVLVTHPAMIGACEAHFNFWGPVPNLALRAVIQQIATSVVASH